MPTVDEVFQQALLLDERDREVLLNWIMGSFENAGVVVDDELLDELQRRSDELDRGEVQAVDAFESIARLRRILREEREK